MYLIISNIDSAVLTETDLHSSRYCVNSEHGNIPVCIHSASRLHRPSYIIPIVRPSSKLRFQTAVIRAPQDDDCVHLNVQDHAHQGRHLQVLGHGRQRGLRRPEDRRHGSTGGGNHARIAVLRIGAFPDGLSARCWLPTRMTWQYLSLLYAVAFLIAVIVYIYSRNQSSSPRTTTR